MPFFSSRPTAIFNVRGSGLKPWLYRQILTKGYVGCGYKDGVPWRNVNSLNMSTDTCTNMGDLFTETANYCAGAQSRDVAFMFGTGGVGAFTSTSVFNMRNDTAHTKTSAMNTAYTCGDVGTIQSHDLNGSGQMCYINGSVGGAFIQKFNLQLEQYISSIATSFGQAGVGASGHFGERQGYWWNDTPENRKFVFSTETETALTNNTVGWHSQQKGFNSKLETGFAGGQGSYALGYTLRKWNYVTETVVSNPSKPIGNCGEENFSNGQTANWMLGMYDDLQTNRAWRYNFATDTGFEGGASMQPTAPGINGRSSGFGYARD
jgi:hypothetical protein